MKLLNLTVNLKDKYHTGWEIKLSTSPLTLILLKKLSQTRVKFMGSGFMEEKILYIFLSIPADLMTRKVFWLENNF